MSRIASTFIIALSLVAVSAGGALAQSYTAPAGIPETTAPGGSVRSDTSLPYRATVAHKAKDIQATGSVAKRHLARKPVHN